MTIKVTALTALNSGNEVMLSIEISNGKDSEQKKLILLAEQFTSLRIGKGEIDTEQFDEIARAANIASAYKKGLYLLGYGACSEKKMRYKLKMKGFDEDSAAAAATMLIEHDCINENSDALREAERCLAKLWGRKRIVAHLYSKGYSDSTVREALSSLSEIDFAENCRKLIERDYARRLNEARGDKAAMAKLCSALVRMGYSFSEIKEASDGIAAD